jgi:peptide/nickel transport system permease protein
MTVARQAALLCVIASIAAGVRVLFTPDAPYLIDLAHRFEPPLLLGGAGDHLLGTDQLGRDLLSRVSQGLFMSLLIATLATTFSAGLGVSLGLAAACSSKRADEILMTLADVQTSVPFLVVALTAIGLAGPSLSVLVVLLALQGWHKFARVARAEARVAWRSDYVLALRTLGASTWRICLRHILPNAAGTLIATGSVIFAEVILLESAISFLGLGVQPPAASLGTLVGSGTAYVLIAAWLPLIPAAVIVLLAASVATLGDWFQQHLDDTATRSSVSLEPQSP